MKKKQTNYSRLNIRWSGHSSGSWTVGLSQHHWAKFCNSVKVPSATYSSKWQISTHEIRIFNFVFTHPPTQFRVFVLKHSIYRSARLQNNFKFPFAAEIIAWTSNWAHSANWTGSSSIGHGACWIDGRLIRTINPRIRTILSFKKENKKLINHCIFQLTNLLSKASYTVWSTEYDTLWNDDLKKWLDHLVFSSP